MIQTPNWMNDLEDTDMNFIKRFLMASGSLKQIAKDYDVTYPTVRLRLDRLIHKITSAETSDQDPYVALIKNLALKEQIDYATAKTLIEAYKEQKEKK